MVNLIQDNLFIVEKRLDEHCKGNQYIDNIIKQEGIENFHFEILKTISNKNELSNYIEESIKKNKKFLTKRWIS